MKLIARINRSCVAWAMAAVPLVLVASAADAARLPSFPKRTPYAEARESLIALGWKPAVTSSDPKRCAPGADECAKYPETVACSGTGLARCMFLWRRGETLIEIGTFGEEMRFVDRVRCCAGCR
jgi:hypothetical protein